MVDRPFWLNRIEAAWQKVPIVWLCGVRRSGKTTRVHQLGEDRIHYVNCDLPVVEDIDDCCMADCRPRFWPKRRSHRMHMGRQRL